ncbi:MAG: hypothetical protein IH994_01685 [Proteobacteria bacterium]|nr:hypothetical protein [Pseudomonadota bacterium]
MSDVIGAQLAAMSEWAGLPPSRRRELSGLLSILSGGALDRPAVPPFKGLSYINRNGLPFQWSLKLENGERDVRFLCEGGRPGTPGAERLQLSLERLGDACGLLGFAWPDWLSECVLPHVLPKNEEWPDHWLSAIWFGVGANTRHVVLKPYFNLNRDAPVERWRRIGRVLQALDLDVGLERLCALSGQVSRDSWPSGLAVDILASGGPGRIKAYFRSGAVRPDWIARWYESLGYDSEFPSVRGILDAFPWQGSGPFPENAFVICLEFHPGDGPPTVKLDLAVDQWIKSDFSVSQRIQWLTKALRLDGGSYASALRSPGCLAPRPHPVRGPPVRRTRKRARFQPPSEPLFRAAPGTRRQSKRPPPRTHRPPGATAWRRNGDEKRHQLSAGSADRWSLARLRVAGRDGRFMGHRLCPPSPGGGPAPSGT